MGNFQPVCDSVLQYFVISVCVPSKTLHFIYMLVVVDVVFFLFFLPARASEQGKVIGVGVHIYITEKPFTSK